MNGTDCIRSRIIDISMIFDARAESALRPSSARDCCAQSYYKTNTIDKIIASNYQLFSQFLFDYFLYLPSSELLFKYLNFVCLLVLFAPNFTFYRT